MQQLAIDQGSLLVEELDRSGFEALATEWDAALAKSGADKPFHRHAFLKLFLDNFEPRARLRVFVAREGRAVIAALPLIEERATLCGLPVRQLRAAVNDHSCRFDLLCREGREDAVDALFSHLTAVGDFDVLLLPDAVEGGAAGRLLARARKLGFPTGTYQSLRTPFIPLAGGWEAQQRKLDAKFKSNLRRRRKKLEEKGTLTFERHTGGLELETLLEEGFALEQSGWKGESGTAIGTDPVVRGFYAEWARQAATDGELALSFLRLDGKPVAFHFGLVRGGVYYVPKLAFDEEHKECSPGQLMLELVLKDCCERGLAEFDFLGPCMPWKLDWTDQVRPHHYLYVFPRSRKGRALHQLKFTVVPVAKEIVKWKP